MFSIKIISLKKDEYKRKKLLSNLKLLDLDSFTEVFDAVNGNELKAGYLERINKNRKPYDLTGFNRDLSRGEIGCLLSHLALYKVMSKDDVFLILEDDVIVEEELNFFVKNLNKLPEDWDVLLLGHQVGRKRPARISIWSREGNGRFALGKPIELACGTYGYMINYQGATKLISMLENIDAPIDHYTGTTKNINLYAIKSPLLYFSEELAEFSNISKQRASIELKNNISSRDVQPYLKRILKKSYVYHPIKFLLVRLRLVLSFLAILKFVRNYKSNN